MNDYQMKKPLECPFCGEFPNYDHNKELVHCQTVDCPMHKYFIHIDEWNERSHK